jgi:hypothetical protein
MKRMLSDDVQVLSQKRARSFAQRCPVRLLVHDMDGDRAQLSRNRLGLYAIFRSVALPW